MLTPDEIKARRFLVSLRGYDRDEVHAFLGQVAEQVGQLQRRVAQLQAQTKAAPVRAMPGEAAEHPPGETAEAAPASESSAVFAEIGQQTQRILEAAHAAAAEITQHAQHEADRELQNSRRRAAQHLADEERRLAAIEESLRSLEGARGAVADELRQVQRTIEQVLRELTPTEERAATFREALASEAHEELRSPEPVADEQPASSEDEEEGSPVPEEAEREEPAPPTGPLELRSEVLSPLHPKVVRRIKRGLGDLQNIVLDSVRRSRGRGDVSDLLFGDEDVATLRGLVADDLDRAYRAGLEAAAVLAGRPLDEPSTERELADEFMAHGAERIRSPLAATLRMGLGAGENAQGLSDRVSAVFGELRNTTAEELAATHLIRAYELGLLDAWTAGGVTHRQWVLGREPRCPEARCRHNDQAGTLAVDETFPSGHEAPPIHVGCTCTTIPIS